MMNSAIKATTAAVLALAGSLAWADTAFTLSSTDGATVVGGVAHPGFTISFPSPFTVIGGQLDLVWTPGTPPNSLVLLPEQLSVGGLSGPALAAVLDPDFSGIVPAGSGDGVTVFAAPSTSSPPPTLTGPLAVGLGLAGNVAGGYDVQYTVTLLDANFDTYTATDSFKVTVSAVPEPASCALMLGGLASIGALVRRRTRTV